jgi:hypothetical protein
MTSATKLGCRLFWVICAFSLSSRADEAADIATARALGVEGVLLADAGRCREAIDKLARAEKLHHAPTTATRLAECEIEVGRLVSGTERLQRVVHEPLAPNAHPAFLASVARARVLLEKTLPRLGSLHLTLGGAACTQPSVRLDDEALSEAALDAPRHVDPGVHRVRVTARGCQPFEASVDVNEGEAKVFTIGLLGAPAEARAAPTSDTRKGSAGGGFTELAMVSFGLGAVAAGLGVTGGLLVASKTRALEEACVARVCPADQDATLASAKVWATVSTVGFIAAGALTVTGLSLLLFPGTSGGNSGGNSESSSERKSEGKSTFRPRVTIGFGAVGVGGQF